MDPLRWELTWQLAGALGVIDGFQVIEPERADAETLGMVHTLGCAAIAALLRAGVRKVGYADVDAHHGDCVQTAFYADPRVMTVSVHETPLASFPGTGYPTESGVQGAADGTAVNTAAGHEPRVPQSSTTRWRAASSMLDASDRHPARLSNMTTLRTKPMTASMDAMPADAMPGANRPADAMPGANRPADASFPATDGQTRLADPCDDLCAYCRGPETD